MMHPVKALLVAVLAARTTLVVAGSRGTWQGSALPSSLLAALLTSVLIDTYLWRRTGDGKLLQFVLALP